MGEEPMDRTWCPVCCDWHEGKWPEHEPVCILVTRFDAHCEQSENHDREERIRNLVGALLDCHAPAKFGPCECVWCREAGELFPDPLPDRPPLPPLPPSGVWNCPKCVYMNTGPICTKCGYILD